MSAQTGSIAPGGPVSSRMIDRARFRIGLWRSQPNPLWIRELRQSARLTRTPLILTLMVVLMTMLIASIGGTVSTDASPATTGTVIFQLFFSLAYFGVTIIGPAVAANSIASEREGRTWEAVILTGLSPATIARGKFFAGVTTIGMYVVMIAPVGAMPFLFGGVTSGEVVVAFAGLFLVALLSVAFGLAVSSRMSHVRSAIVATLFLAFPVSIVAFLMLGVASSFAAHHAWPAVPEGYPIWLPTAYARAPFGTDYVVFLVALPIVVIAVPAWFLYEVTIANLTSPNDDHTSGLKRWFLFATPALTAVSCVPIAMTYRSSKIGWSVAALSAAFAFVTFGVFLFLGDSLGPSRRVTLRWDRERAGRVRRFLGPGLVSSAKLLLGAALASVGAIASFAALQITRAAASPRSGAVVGLDADATAILLFGGYVLGFLVFVIGLGTWLRVRTGQPLGARLILLAGIFGISVVPWVITAMGGFFRDRWDHVTFAIAAPSPFFAFLLLDHSLGPQSFTVHVALATMSLWAMIGIVLFGDASRRNKAIIAAHETALAEGDRRLAKEDEREPAPAEPIKPELVKAEAVE